MSAPGPTTRAARIAEAMRPVAIWETENQRWLRLAAARLREMNKENADGY